MHSSRIPKGSREQREERHVNQSGGGGGRWGSAWKRRRASIIAEQCSRCSPDSVLSLARQSDERAWKNERDIHHHCTAEIGEEGG